MIAATGNSQRIILCRFKHMFHGFIHEANVCTINIFQPGIELKSNFHLRATHYNVNQHKLVKFIFSLAKAL